MKPTIRRLSLTLVAPVLALVVGCGSDTGPTGGATGNHDGASSDETVAIVAGKPITLGEIEAEAAGQLIRVRQQRYDALRGTLERVGVTRLLEAEAAERGITVEQLRIDEVESRVEDPTDNELRRMYETANYRARGQSFEDLRQRIFNKIQRDRVIALEIELFAKLKEKYGFEVKLEAPRVELALTDANPSQGDPDAPITLVEFGDYECPFCRRAHTTVQRVMAEYGDKIRHVFVDYPLADHAQAVPAAIAAYCAGEQDMYWDYAEHLMIMSGDLRDDDLQFRAVEIGLDGEAFRECRNSGRYDDAINAGMAMGSAAGVNSTPTFFINGRILTGSKTFEIFKMIIDEELAANGG
jgi:protein-disulfide isomerase